MNTNTPKVQAAEIICALSKMLKPGQVTELRALDALVGADRRPQTFSGYFDDIEKLAQAAATIRAATGVYFVPNVVDPRLLARAANRIEAAGKRSLTTDADIVARCALLIDADPRRPAGISSTDREHDDAIARVRRIRDTLRKWGWPEPMLCDSGNGGHADYLVDLPRDDGGLAKRCLEALAVMFDDDAVSIDTSVHSAAQLWKLPGTWARKGDSTSERPHRMANVLESPDVLEVVPRDKLEALAAMAPQAEAKPPSGRNGSGGGTFDLADWVAERGLDVGEPKAWQGATQRRPLCGGREGR